MPIIQSGWKAPWPWRLHDRLDGRVGLDALEDLDLETGLLKVRLDVLQKAATAHGAAASHDHGFGALEVLDLVASTLTKIQVARIGETSHYLPPISRNQPRLRGAPLAPHGLCPQIDRFHRSGPNRCPRGAPADSRVPNESVVNRSITDAHIISRAPIRLGSKSVRLLAYFALLAAGRERERV